MKAKTIMTVRSNERIAEGVYALHLQYRDEDRPIEVNPGQFVGVYSNDASRLLPRPISICRYIAEEQTLVLVYRVVGTGTTEFSRLQVGETVKVLGILGNGYDPGALSGKRVLLLGGGIGAPPMLGLAYGLAEANAAAGAGSITAALGYRTNDLFLAEEFKALGDVIIATDDGTTGYHGNVVAAVKNAMVENKDLRFDVLCSCGPLPMLRGVKALAEELGVPCYLSLEERMACGVGACLGCVTKTKEVDGHSKVKNARICTEGPVFNAADVEI